MSNDQRQPLELELEASKANPFFVDEAYFQFYVQAWDRIRSFLTSDELDAARKNSRTCMTLLHEFGYLLTQEHVKRQKVEKETIERDRISFLILFFCAAAGLILLIGYDFDNSALVGLLAPVLVYVPLRYHIFDTNVKIARESYEDAKNQTERIRYEIEILNPQYSARLSTSEDFALLLLFDAFRVKEKRKGKGRIEPAQLPLLFSGKSRSYETLIANLGFDLYDPFDQRWPEKVSRIVYYKTLIAAAHGIERLDHHEIENGFIQDYNFIPQVEWDWPDFIDGYVAFEIKNIARQSR